MINFTDQGFCIDGVTMIDDSLFLAIAEDGQPYPIEAMGIADGQGGAAKANVNGVFRIDGEINWVLYKTLALAPGIDYSITGTVYPVGGVVYLVDAYVSPENLTSEHIADVLDGVYMRRTRSDSTDGYFQFNGVTTDGGFVTLLAFVSLSEVLALGLNASLTADKTAYGTVDDGSGSDDPAEIEDDIALMPFNVNPEADNARNWTVTITGHATPGMTVYFSSVVSYNVNNLLSALLASTTTGDDGYFSLSAIGITARGTFALWNLTAAGAVSDASMTLDVHICLSGDTLITMADGTEKRLDALTVGELVRGGDGTPTAITRLARGVFRPEHRLYQFSDGTLIDAPHDHRFYNREQGFFQLLSRWQLGEHAVREDGAETALEEVTTIHERAELFGIWTESHDYWANGLLSGETAANQRFIATATVEQAAEMAASLTDDAALRLLGLEDFYP